MIRIKPTVINKPDMTNCGNLLQHFHHLLVVGHRDVVNRHTQHCSTTSRSVRNWLRQGARHYYMLHVHCLKYIGRKNEHKNHRFYVETHTMNSR